MLSPFPQTPEPDPFDTLRAERRSQYGVSIAYVKSQVGPGVEYANEAARAVVSAHGGWCQLAELPEEFVGATGAGVSHRLLTRPALLSAVAGYDTLLQAAARGDLPLRRLSVYALYEGGSLRDRRGVFVLDCASGRPLFSAGAWQPEAIPRFLKVCLHAEPGTDWPARLGLPLRGVQFLLVPAHTDHGGALLATLAPSAGSADLSTRPASPTAH